MTQTQKYTVKPKGLIKEGQASYILDLDTGNITYSATVVAGVWIFTKTYKFSGSYQVDLEELESGNMVEGNEILIGSAIFTVEEADGVTAQVGVVITGQDMTGTAVFNTTEPYVKLNSLTAKATVDGKVIDLILEEV